MTKHKNHIGNSTGILSTPLYIPRQQKGSTLIFSLLLLSTMSLLGLGAMQAAVLEQKMASNFRFESSAFHAAEVGIAEAIRNHTNNHIVAEFSTNVGQNSCIVQVTNDAGGYSVTSTATHTTTGSRRQLQVVLSGPVGSSPTLELWHSDG